MKVKLLLIYVLISLTTYAQKNQLNYFLNQALSNSPLLKDYQNQTRASIYDSLLIKAAYKPQVTGTSYNDYAPIINGYGYDQAITNGGTFNALIEVNKELGNRKTIQAQLQSIQLQNLSSENSIKISEQELKRTIIAQYITTYGDLLQLNYNREVNVLLSNQEIILKKLTQKNVYKQVDYLSFLVTLQQQNLTIKQLEIQYQNDHSILNYVCGINDTSFTTIEEPKILLQQLPSLTQSVFFEQFKIDSLKLANSKLLIGKNYRPKINLFADAGYNSTLAYSAYKNFGTSFGISAVIPIYDGKQRRAKYSKVDLSESTRKNYESFYSNQYNQQISQLTSQLHNTEALINDMNAEIEYSKSLIETYGKLLETGEVRITDYILSLNNYLNIKSQIAQNNITRLQIINQINYYNR